MNIILDADTKNALKSNLESKNKEAVRLMIRSFGWGGPTLGVVLDEQREEDRVELIDDIKFVAEEDIAFLFENIKLIYKKGVFGDSFSILNPNASHTC